jgi:TetR/AcrR family transcriptional repressor of lmrAB and yxaGH operons
MSVIIHIMTRPERKAMPRRSDAKQKMVAAARQLIRERGYNGTVFSDVLELSDAPRGSVYFHFPRGKAQMVIEAAASHAVDQVEIINQAAHGSRSAAEFIERYLDLGRDGLVASDYGRGCGIAPLIIDGATRESVEIEESARQAFSELAERLAFHFIAFGIDGPDARALADALFAGMQGALITSRALRSPAPFDAVKLALVNQANNLSPKGAAR